MKVTIADKIGYCSGVEDAILTVKKHTRTNKGKIIILGDLIHNNNTLQELTKYVDKIVSHKDLTDDYINSLSEDDFVFFSAHGHTIQQEEILLSKNISYIDTTCSIVKAIHSNIIKLLEDCNNQVAIIGKKDHPEVQSILSISEKVVFYSNSSRLLVDFDCKNSKLFVFNQTTISEDHLIESYKHMLLRHPKPQNITFRNTLCPLVVLRTNHSIKNIKDKNFDLIIVVGSSTSSNTVELFSKLKKEFKTKKVIRVENVNELLLHNLKPYNNTFITSGTSASRQTIDEIKEYLEKII